MEETMTETEDGLLTAWREQHGLTRRGAARALGCSRNTWGRWETGETPVPRYVLLALQALSQELETTTQPDDTSGRPDDTSGDTGDDDDDTE
jgi:transcriptional regulator with XRE-family HTH domain